jgi:hypothetical protein
MSIRYDPLLAAALAEEIGERWGHRRITEVVLEPRARALELHFDEGPSLLALLHPEAGYLLARDDRIPAPGVRFRRLFLGRSWAPEDERSLFLDLVDGGGRIRHQVVFELATNQWNGLITDVKYNESSEPLALIRSVLWPRDAGGRRLRPGAVHEPAESHRRGADLPVTLAEWRSVLASTEAGSRRRTALQSFAYLSALNVEHVLGAVAAEETLEERALAGHAREEQALVEAGLEEAFRRYTEVCSGTGEAWLLERRWGLQPYVSGLGERGARPVGSLLEAMEEAASAAGGVDRFVENAVLSEPAQRVTGGPAGHVEETGALRSALVRRQRRVRKRLAALAREQADTGDPNESRSIGHLLLARLSELPARGVARVEVIDFDGSLRAVELDPALDVAANARAYFEEAARRQRASAKLPRAIADAEREVARLAEALERLEAEGPDDALWELVGGRPEPASGGALSSADEPQPYLRLRSSGGLEIRVGRSARANDRLTFAFSAPDDIWLHARQVQGAHVILRWGRKEENPPKQDLLEAAVVAAVHSGARHSGSVAVDWTRRKHVRKPRKAPPGTVIPDRVKTLFVEPDEGLVKRLRARAGE